jgi:3-oxoacyl-[acyl-carrier protein] reductase
MFKYFINKFKKIDVLINNAGIAKIQLFTDTTNDDWEKMINNNLTSAFYTTREAYLIWCLINLD